MHQPKDRIAETMFVQAEDARGSDCPSLTGRISYKEIWDVIDEIKDHNDLEAALLIPQRYTAYPDTTRVWGSDSTEYTIHINDTPILEPHGKGTIDDTCTWGVTITVIRPASLDECAQGKPIYSTLILEIARRYREALRSENMISSLYYPNEPQ